MMEAPQPKEMIANQPPLGLHSPHTTSERARMSPKEGKSEHTMESENTEPQPEKITSRFGEITIDKAKAILFPVGILGMPDKHHFVLTDFPNPKLKQFKLLQSLDDHELSFITLPLELENSILERGDIENACKDMEIPTEDLGVVLIVSVHRGLTNVQLSVNARAPIFVDSKRKAAAQYVFTSSKYKVQHFITESKESEGESKQP